MKNVRAKIINYDITETKKGDPQVTVLFEYSEGDGLNASSRQITWWGHTSEKAMPYTLRNLYTLGYRGKTMQDFLKLSDGIASEALDLAREVNLALEEETKENGSKFLKVAFINDPDRAPGGIKNAMPKDKIKLKLGAMNIEGQMAVIRQEMGLNQNPKAAQPGSTREPGQDDDFDVGF